MQMMDLPDYLDSFRLGYERALERPPEPARQRHRRRTCRPGTHRRTGGSGTRRPVRINRSPASAASITVVTTPITTTGATASATTVTTATTTTHDAPWPRVWLRARYDCRCDCCIVDADYVVYARCFERRVVPIQIENDTRKVREDVTLDVSEVRSAGGRVLPWKVSVLPQSPLTLEPCSTTEIDLVVEIECRDTSQKPEPQDQPAPGKAAAQKAADAKEAEAPRTRYAPRLRAASTSTTAKSATSPSAWADASSDPSWWRSRSSPATAMPTTRRARAAAADEIASARCRRCLTTRQPLHPEWTRAIAVARRRDRRSVPLRRPPTSDVSSRPRPRPGVDPEIVGRASSRDRARSAGRRRTGN